MVWEWYSIADIGLILMCFFVILVSILIRKPYAFFILHQSILHIFHLIFSNGFFVSPIQAFLNFYGIYATMVMRSADIAPFFPTILLVISRVIGIYAPNFYDKYVTNKTVIPIILIWDLVFYGLFCGFWYYHIFYLRTCPNYPSNACDDALKYMNTTIGKPRQPGFATDFSQFYTSRIYKDPNLRSLEFVKYVNYWIPKDVLASNYSSCAGLSECYWHQQNYYFREVLNFLYAVFTGLIILLTVCLLYAIGRHFKTQLQINKSSFITSVKISIILSLQGCSLALFCYSNFSGLAKNGVSFTSYLAFYVYNFFMIFYIFFDGLLILFLLNDYRHFVLYFIPKHNAQNRGISSTSIIQLAAASKT